jgi:hypothetical protein
MVSIEDGNPCKIPDINSNDFISHEVLAIANLKATPPGMQPLHVSDSFFKTCPLDDFNESDYVGLGKAVLGNLIA